MSSESTAPGEYAFCGKCHAHNATYKDGAVFNTCTPALLNEFGKYWQQTGPCNVKRPSRSESNTNTQVMLNDHISELRRNGRLG